MRPFYLQQFFTPTRRRGTYTRSIQIWGHRQGDADRGDADRLLGRQTEGMQTFNWGRRQTTWERRQRKCRQRTKIVKRQS